MLMIGKYSFGVGDRFGRQAGAQLQALIRAVQQGVDVVPVVVPAATETIVPVTLADGVAVLVFVTSII